MSRVVEHKVSVLRASWVAALDTLLILIALLSIAGTLTGRGDGPICLTVSVAALAIIERLR